MLVLLQSIAGVFTFPALNALAWSCFVISVFYVALVLTKCWHVAPKHGVQRFHTSPTPSIISRPIVLAPDVAWGKASLAPMLFAGMLAFLFVVVEDIAKRVGVIQGLLAEYQAVQAEVASAKPRPSTNNPTEVLV